jgi:hypothetical protein
LSTITDQPGLHSRNWTCGAGANFDASFPAGFAAGFAMRRGTAFRARVVRLGDARRDVLVAVIGIPFIPRRAGFIFISRFLTALIFVLRIGI